MGGLRNGSHLLSQLSRREHWLCEVCLWSVFTWADEGCPAPPLLVAKPTPGPQPGGSRRYYTGESDSWPSRVLAVRRAQRGPFCYNEGLSNRQRPPGTWGLWIREKLALFLCSG